MRNAIKSSFLAAALAASALVTSTAWAQASTWAQYKSQAAQRIMDWNRAITFEGEPPPILASIPVLRVNLNEDGSVERIDVVREPQNAPETLQYAMDAIMRSAPFGDVSSLPMPWAFTETFLYNDDMRFQLRSLQR